MDTVQMPGVGLALSGGGFRATLFHLGSLWRLNELGWLPQVSCISSVSGGSIVAGLLGARWQSLAFDDHGVAVNFQQQVADPIRWFCTQNVDIPATLMGLFGAVPFVPSGSHYLAGALKNLYGNLSLSMLPAPAQAPEFMIDATNLQTGSCFRFMRDGLQDYKLGRYPADDISLADAVSASCAFPPFFSPLILRTTPARWRPGPNSIRLTEPALRQTIYLGDGGIYDNLGLEAVWNEYGTVLVSDAGAPFQVEVQPSGFLYGKVLRSLDIATEQTRALRKRRLIADLTIGHRYGTYWGITTQIQHYDLERPMTRDNALTASLANIRTRLNRFSAEEQGRLINWGYALADAAMRRHVLAQDIPPGRWPIPQFSL
jgi:NTE family protein